MIDLLVRIRRLRKFMFPSAGRPLDHARASQSRNITRTRRSTVATAAQRRGNAGSPRDDGIASSRLDLLAFCSDLDQLRTSMSAIAMRATPIDKQAEIARPAVTLEDDVAVAVRMLSSGALSA
jgi:hypothetical protein